MIQYVKRKYLDEDKYNFCIENSIQSKVYAFSLYLDIVADNWDVLVLNDYKAVMPIPWNKKFLLKYSLQPFFCQQLGVYSKEILELSKKNLINSAAHITGGGLIENLLRSVPKNLSLNIDLSSIKIKKIFKWLKSKNISDEEMMKTFNCGIGFCLIVQKKNIKKIKKIFSNKFTLFLLLEI